MVVRDRGRACPASERCLHPRLLPASPLRPRKLTACSLIHMLEALSLSMEEPRAARRTHGGVRNPGAPIGEEGVYYSKRG